MPFSLMPVRWRFPSVLMLAIAFVSIFAAAPARAQQRALNCSAGQQALGRQAMLQASSLSRRGSLNAALHLLESSLGKLDGRCSVRATVLTEKAGIHLRLGQMREARQASSAALGFEYGEQIPAQERGMDEYILASACNAMGQKARAVQEYLLAARTFSQAGASEMTNAARVYSDLAMLYVRSADVPSAERYLDEALRAERSARNPDKTEQLTRQDALMHLDFLKGRLSDALSLIGGLIRSYGRDEGINSALRAHLYRDYGQLFASIGKLDESIQYLEHSVALELEVPGAPPQELAFSWAFLARIQILRKQFDAAEATLMKAQNRIGPFEYDFPQDAAIVAETYGVLLNLQSRCPEARIQLQRALQLAGSSPDLDLMRAEGLRALAQADRRLHRRVEAKQARAELKHLRARGFSEADPDTVDVLTLARNHQPASR